MAETRQEKGETRSLAQWRPFGELEPWSGLFEDRFLPRRITRLMDELLREWPSHGHVHAFVPAMDVSDDEKQYTITVELPGCRKDDVHVELQENTVTIRGEKKSEREEQKEQRRYAERYYGAFSRSFRLPADADGERLGAAFSDGVLTVTIPKTEEAKPRAIAIN